MQPPRLGYSRTILSRNEYISQRNLIHFGLTRVFFISTNASIENGCYCDKTDMIIIL